MPLSDKTTKIVLEVEVHDYICNLCKETVVTPLPTQIMWDSQKYIAESAIQPKGWRVIADTQGVTYLCPKCCQKWDEYFKLPPLSDPLEAKQDDVNGITNSSSSMVPIKLPKQQTTPSTSRNRRRIRRTS